MSHRAAFPRFAESAPLGAAVHSVAIRVSFRLRTDLAILCFFGTFRPASSTQ
jgi:hypothetical protein